MVHTLTPAVLVIGPTTPVIEMKEKRTTQLLRLVQGYPGTVHSFTCCDLPSRRYGGGPAAALYLASDEASMLTGVLLEVDGGRCI